LLALLDFYIIANHDIAKINLIVSLRRRSKPKDGDDDPFSLALPVVTSVAEYIGMPPNAYGVHIISRATWKVSMQVCAKLDSGKLIFSKLCICWNRFSTTFS